MAHYSNLSGPLGGASIGVPTRGPTSAKPLPSSRPSTGGFWDRVQAIGQQKWDQMIAGPQAGYIPANPDINADAVNAGASSAQAVIKNPPGSAGRPGVSSRPSGGGSSGGHTGGAPSASGIDYLYADLAKHYGFSKETAYQEALANTQYSRAVEDMQRAGLNPASIFGSGRGYTAGDDIWPSSPGGGGSGGGRGGRRSGGRGGSGNGKLFSSSAYSVLAFAGGAIGAAITKSPTGFWVGTMTAQAAMNAANLLFKGGR